MTERVAAGLLGFMAGVLVLRYVLRRGAARQDREGPW